MTETLTRPAAPSARRVEALLHQSRAIGSAAAAVGFSALAIAWGWAEGVLVAALSVATFSHAMWRRSRVDHPPIDVLVIDIAAVAAMIHLTAPPPAVALVPIGALTVASLLVLPPRAAGLVIAFASLSFGAALVAGSDRIGAWSVTETLLLLGIVSAVFLPFVGMILRAVHRTDALNGEYLDQLQARETRYYSLVEGLPVGVYRTTDDGQFTEANQALVDMLGFPDRQTLLATSVFDVYDDPNDRDRWRAGLDVPGNIDTRIQQLVRLRGYDDRIIWVRDTGVRAIDDTGTVEYFEGTLQNITSEVRLAAYEQAITACAEALLTEQGDEAIRRGLQAVLEAADTDIVFVDRNVEDAELGPCADLVYQASRLPTRPADDQWSMVPWSKMPLAHEALSASKPFAFHVADLEGDERQVYEGSPIASELDVPISYGREWLGVIGFGDTDGSRSWTDNEIGILQTVARLLGSAWERDRQQERLEALVRSRDRFIASVSHRLRTPLTAVVGASALLREPSTPERYRFELAEALADQSLEIANVVEDLLVAARADVGTVLLNPEPVDLAAVARATISAICPDGVPTVEVIGGPVTAFADTLRVRQIVRNILDNAARYGGTEVAVRLHTDGDRARLEVCDNGPGLPGDFEPFAVLEAPRAVDQPPGPLGLGLAISQRLARMMEGDLTYHRDGDVTVFRLELPIPA